MSRFRKNPQTYDLLNKVNSQLKGEKVQKKDTDDGLGDYLSSLGKKTGGGGAVQMQWDKFGEEDLSLSSDNDTKKPAPQPQTTNKFLKKKAIPAKEEKTPVKTQQTAATSKIGALRKASTFDEKYSKKPTRSELMKFSDSDLDDMSGMSLDEDIVQSMKKAPTKASTQKTPQPKSRTKSPETLSEDSDFAMGGAKFRKTPAKMPTYGSVLSDDDSFGQSGNRFIKKKPEKIKEVIEKEDDDEEPAMVITPKPTPKKKKDMFSLRSAEKYGSQVVLDSDEESLQNFIEGLSPKASPKERGSPIRSPQRSPQRSPHRSPSPPLSPARTPKGILKRPQTPRTPTMEYISEEDESVVDSLRESIASDDSFKSSSIASSIASSVHPVNVMDVESLQEAFPEPEPTPRKPPSGKTKADVKPSSSASTRAVGKLSRSSTKEPTDILSSLGLQSVEDLLGPVDNDDEADEVKTEPYDSDTPSRPTTPLRSILSPSPRPLTPRSSRSRVRLSLTDVREVGGSRSPSPEVIHTSRTRTASIAYSEDFDEDSVRTETVRTEGGSDSDDSNRTLTSPRGRSRKSSYSEYSDDFTTSTYTSSPRRSRKNGRPISRTSSRDSTYSTFSDSFSDSESSSPSPESRPRSRKVDTRSTEVQTGLNVGDMIYQWNENISSIPLSYPLGVAGTSYRDPALIATQVVGKDTLEAMTTFSPSVLALNELLRSHLEMTRGFLETQKRLHADLAATTYPDYQYTTLEDTHKYIKQNKRKTLTFDQALRQVRKEMGLKGPGQRD